MKVGIIGVGAVGTACAKSMLLRGSCHEIVLLDVNKDRAQGVATDLSHGGVLCPATRIRAGEYRDLKNVAVVIITAGINEQTGNAIDRGDKLGRLRLLPHNARVYRKIVPRIARVAPRAPLLVVTDPPDALADVARKLTRTNPVFSSGTFLDTLRFRVQVAQRLGCHPSFVDALVIGEHGTSQVYVWSSARVAGAPLLNRVGRDRNVARFQATVEEAVRNANIDIIKGTGASQHGIGIVTARIIEAMLRDEGLVAPIGVFHPEFNVTLSLPAVIRHGGVSKVLAPVLSRKETDGLVASAAAIRGALTALGRPSLSPLRSARKRGREPHIG